jgi:hypothetical protein
MKRSEAEGHVCGRRANVALACNKSLAVPSTTFAFSLCRGIFERRFKVTRIEKDVLVKRVIATCLCRCEWKRGGGGEEATQRLSNCGLIRSKKEIEK